MSSVKLSAAPSSKRPSILKRIADDPPDAIHILQNIIIPEAQKSIAPRLQPRRAPRIATPPLFFIMLAAIHLNNQLLLKTDKIHNTSRLSDFPNHR